MGKKRNTRLNGWKNTGWKHITLYVRRDTCRKPQHIHIRPISRRLSSIHPVDTPDIPLLLRTIREVRRIADCFCGNRGRQRYRREKDREFVDHPSCDPVVRYPCEGRVKFCDNGVTEGTDYEPYALHRPNLYINNHFFPVFKKKKKIL